MKYEFRNVYSKKNNKITLRDLSFTLTNNDFLSVFFSDTDSKESFIECILSKNSLKSGNIYLDSLNLTKLEPRDRRCAFVSQNPLLLDNLTIYDNIALPLRKTKMKEDEIEAKVDNIMNSLKIDYLGGIMPKYISLYQALKISLARAIAFNSEVIILDDPLSLSLDREDEYIEYIKNIYEYLDRPIIIYLGRITPLTKKVLTISSDGEMLDFSRIEVLKEYPLNNRSLEMLNLPIKEEILNKKYQILNASINGEVLTYENRTINLNKILLKNILFPELVSNIRLNKDYFDIQNKGNDLKFLIKNIDRYDSIMVVETEYFNLYKLYDDRYKVGEFIYYPLERIDYYNDNNRLNTNLNLSNNMLTIKVLNGFKGLIQINNRVFNLGKHIPKNMTTIEININSINKLSTNIKDGLEIERIIYIEEFLEFYFLELKLVNQDKNVVVKVDKMVDILEEDNLSLILDSDSFKLSSYL